MISYSLNFLSCLSNFQATIKGRQCKSNIRLGTYVCPHPIVMQPSWFGLRSFFWTLCHNFFPFPYFLNQRVAFIISSSWFTQWNSRQFLVCILPIPNLDWEKCEARFQTLLQRRNSAEYMRRWKVDWKVGGEVLSHRVN